MSSPGDRDGPANSLSLPRGPVAIVGGGLAGLAAAAALLDCGVPVVLFEARRMLGGRATSFRDPTSGQWVDHCQHVSLGCCTNLADFCRRTGLADSFRRDRTLHFFSSSGREYDMTASRWLPAPLHLAPSLLRLGFLTLGQRISIGRTLLKLARQSALDDPTGPTIGQWLRQQRQTPQAIERFWEVVLVSALGESVERASLPAARKVFVDGFLSNRRGYEIEVPVRPLGELYGERLQAWLAQRGATLQLGSPVKRVAVDAAGCLRVELSDGRQQSFEQVIVAVAWRRVADVLGEELLSRLPDLRQLAQIEGAPITGVHLWFDRPITQLPHAVLIGTLAQWLFSRERSSGSSAAVPGGAHYYQVVISASRELAGRAQREIIDQVRDELRNAFPAAREAQLLHARLVTEPQAVFSVRPGLDRLRPDQRTAVPNLFLAGDYTATGWPATMEGAVRSGYLAAEGALAARGRPQQLLQPDLPRTLFAKRLI